jgi:hypothetical protein
LDVLGIDLAHKRQKFQTELPNSNSRAINRDYPKTRINGVSFE